MAEDRRGQWTVGDRSVTRPQRGLGPQELSSLSRDNIRKLCHALWIAEGAVIEEYSHLAGFDQFLLAVPSLWHVDTRLVRIYDRIVESDDLVDVLEAAQLAGAVAGLVVPPRGIAENAIIPDGLHVVPPAELASRIARSSLVEWDEATPTPALERLELFLGLADTAALLDPVGIQWLPSLALNELPPQLIGIEVEPEVLLERKAFRLLTACFRFGGTRFGEKRRGERLPDAVLDWPDGSSTSAILDCKAAGSGYRMDSDHLLRFEEYWERLSGDLSENGRDLRYLVVLSSFFSGQEGDRHPYYGRAAEILERTGLTLVYVTASDLAWAAAEIESTEVSLKSRAELDWKTVFDAGLVQSQDFREALERLGG